MATRDDIENLQEELSQTRNIASDIGQSLREAFRDGSDEAKRLGRELASSLRIFNSIDRASGSIYSLLEKIAKKEASIKEINKEKNKISKLEADLLSEIGKVQQRKLTLNGAELDLAEELEAQLGEQLRTLQEHKNELDNITRNYKQHINYVEKIEKTWSNIKNLPIVALFKKIVDLALAADVQTTELAKSLGIGKDQARGIYQNFSDYAKATGDTFVTTKKLMEAQSELTQQLGVSVKYTNEEVEDFSRLTKLMGLSAEQAGKLARMSIINGKSIEATTKSIIKGSAAAQRENKISVDQREVLKDVANLSAGILVKFNQNPEALGRAVVEARKLGLSLAEVDKIGDSLLDWTSSIGNELEAELLTNRQINVEKARYAALTGDQATLMKEVAVQAGSLNEYENLNVIAQESLAKAFGMNREEMSKMLLEQEKINKLGDISQMTLDQQLEALRAQGEPLDSALYKQIQQQSIQEKFNNAIEKMQDLVGNLVAGPLGTFLDMMVSLSEHSSILLGVLGAIAGISLVKTIGSLVTMGIQMGIISVEAITANAALTFGLGTVAVLAGIGVLMGALSSAKNEAQNVKDGIAPASKGPFTITDAYGATAITAAGDNIAVSPNMTRGGGGGGNNTELLRQQQRTNELLEASMNRPAVAYINGQDAFANNLGRSNSLGTSQVQNSYRLA